MSEATHDEFAESYPHPVLEFDAGGQLLYVNRAGRTVFPELEQSHRPQALLQGAPAIVSMLDHGQQHIAREVGVSKSVYAQEFVCVQPGERYRVYMTDVTERKRLDQLKDEFISTVSHELRTPLTIIKGAISNLQDGIVGTLTAPQQKVVETANRNVDRLTRIINDLLDLSRLESGRSVLHRRATTVTSLLREVMHNFSVVAAEAGITCDVDAGVEALRAYADPDLLLQVITNLTTNALRFANTRITCTTNTMTYDEVRAAAQLSPLQLPTPLVDVNASCVVLAIADDGPGIPAAERDHLFSKFAQLHRPVGGAGYKGTGLGLAICHAIVEQHRGAIWYEAAAPHGARFCCALPAYHPRSEWWATVEQRIQYAELQQQRVALLILRTTPDADGARVRECEAMVRERIVRQPDDVMAIPEYASVCLVLDGGAPAIAHVLPRWEHVQPRPAGEWAVWHAVYPDDVPTLDAAMQAMQHAWAVPTIPSEDLWRSC